MPGCAPLPAPDPASAVTDRPAPSRVFADQQSRSSGRWLSTCPRGEVNSSYAAEPTAVGAKAAIRWQFWNTRATPKCRSMAPRMASLASARRSCPRACSDGGGTSCSPNGAPGLADMSATAALITLWVPETALTAVDLPIRHRRASGMIRRWH